MIDPNTLAMMGGKDPSVALSDLGLYTGANMAAQATQANAQQQTQGPATFAQLWEAKYGMKPKDFMQTAGQAVNSLANISDPIAQNVARNEMLGAIKQNLGLPDGVGRSIMSLLGGIGGGRVGRLWNEGGDAGSTADGGRADGAGEE